MDRSESAKIGWLKRRATFVPPMKGKKMSEESRRKMREAAKARPSNRIGKKHTVETRQKISEITRERALRGDRCHSYKDGKAAERRGKRGDQEVRRWRFDVFARDGFCCAHCGDDRGRNLNAHHIKPWADYPELRFEVGNGITLCKSCHWLCHAYGLEFFSAA